MPNPSSTDCPECLAGYLKRLTGQQFDCIIET
jgi:hypothetical protein